MKYAIEYRHGGKRYGFLIDAEDWDDAQSRLSSIASGRVVGSDAFAVSVNSFTLPFVAVFVRFFVWCTKGVNK